MAARPPRRGVGLAVRVGWAAAIWVGLAVALTWPTVTHLGTALPGPPGDNFEYLWKLWWVAEALTSGQSPLWNPEIFFPVGYPLALSETTLAHLLPALPLTLVWGEVVSYNLTMLATFALSGGAMWLLARQQTGSVWGAWLAAIVWAFSPYRMAHLGAGHLPLMGTAWLPLCLLYAERALTGGRPRDGALAGLFWALAALSSWYYGYLLVLFLALWGALRLRRRLFALQWWRAAFAGGLVAAMLVTPALLPLVRLRPASPHYTLRYLDHWSASPLDFLAPSALHPLWGGAVAERFPQNPQERLLTLGWVPLALGGWYLARRWRQAGGRRGLTGAWGALGGVAVLLALGTTLHLGSTPLRLPAPDFIAGRWGAVLALVSERLALNPAPYWSLHEAGTLLLPLPTLGLYLFLPFFNAMRVWSRFGLFATLAVAMLAAFGLARIVRASPNVLKERRRQQGIGWVVLGLALVELWPAPLPYGQSLVVAQPVDGWLATAPHGAVALLPPERGWYGYSLWQNRVHGQPLAYGYGTFAPPAFSEAAPVLERFPAPESLALLRGWGVRYLVIAPEGYGARWPEIERALVGAGLRQVWAGDGRPLFQGDRLLHRLPPDPAVPALDVAVGSRQWWVRGAVVVFEMGEDI